jgi:small GTP-binding protein
MKRTLKVVITGPFGAGKTEFIRNVSEIAIVTTERKVTTREKQIKAETTVAMDFGRLTVGRNILHLFGTPGQARFEFMWDILAKEMHGFVILVDSTDKKSFAQAKRLIGLFTEDHEVPFVVAANKQDLKGALRPSEVRRSLGVGADVPVLGCVSVEPESVKSVLVQLAQMIVWTG